MDGDRGRGRNRAGGRPERRFRRAPSQSLVGALIGVNLALLAPLSLLIASALADGSTPTQSWALHRLHQHPLEFAILTICMMLVLAVSGFMAGRGIGHAVRLSNTDPLTGLANRRYFFACLREELRRNGRHDRPSCLVSVDLDRLKAINDRRGHVAGDEAIIAVARSLSRSLRGADIVARIGGDEFAVLLPETTAAEAESVVRRILEDIRQLARPREDQLTVSIGVAELKAGGAGVTDEVFQAADEALYLAKAAGGGHAVISTPKLGMQG